MLVIQDHKTKKKKKKIFKIVHRCFSKEDKWSLIFLNVGSFQCLWKNQKHNQISIRILWKNISIRISNWNFIRRLIAEKINSRKMNQITTHIIIAAKLLMLLAQVQAGNTSENLLNEIKQIFYSLYWTKQILKKVKNNLLRLT